MLGSEICIGFEERNVQVIFIIRQSLFYFSFIHSLFIRISLYDIIF